MGLTGFDEGEESGGDNTEEGGGAKVVMPNRATVGKGAQEWRQKGDADPADGNGARPERHGGYRIRGHGLAEIGAVDECDDEGCEGGVGPVVSQPGEGDAILLG